MLLSPRVRRLFENPERAFDHRSFKLIDWCRKVGGKEQYLVALCEADSFRGLLAAFAEITAKDLKTPLADAHRQICSGEDFANAWTCMDAQLLAFVRGLADPALAVAAFLLNSYLEPRFGKASRSAYFGDVESQFPGYGYLLEFCSPQTEEAFCVIARGSRASPAARAKRRR
jgi:hypothetical protein